jgi:hypothetical protein
MSDSLVGHKRKSRSVEYLTFLTDTEDQLIGYEMRDSLNEEIINILNPDYEKTGYKMIYLEDSRVIIVYDMQNKEIEYEVYDPDINIIWIFDWIEEQGEEQKYSSYEGSDSYHYSTDSPWLFYNSNMEPYPWYERIYNYYYFPTYEYNYYTTNIYEYNYYQNIYEYNSITILTLPSSKTTPKT